MSTLNTLRRVVVALAILAAVVLPTARTAALTPTTGVIVAYGAFSAPGLTTSPPGTTSLDWTTWPTRSWSLWATPYFPNVPLVNTTNGPCIANRTGPTKAIDPLGLCFFLVTGSMWGWCDLSKGQDGPDPYGFPHYYSTAGLGYPFGSWAVITSFRWSGVGRTLAVTGTMESESYGLLNTGVPTSGDMAGTFAGTVTLLEGTGTTLLDLCTDPDGVQSPIPVLITLNYVLQ